MTEFGNWLHVEDAYGIFQDVKMGPSQKEPVLISFPISIITHPSKKQLNGGRILLVHRSRVIHNREAKTGAA